MASRSDSLAAVLLILSAVSCVSSPRGQVVTPQAIEPSEASPEGPRPDPGPGPLVALIDSGLNPRADARFQGAAGRIDPSASPGDLRDDSGHGTALARRILELCPRCRLLPIAVTREGPGITPQVLASAIDRARRAGARVINVSLGLDQGSSALERSVREASSAAIPVVVAAGVGIDNPFRPGKLSDLYPQAYRDTLVVAWVDSRGRPDPGANFGDRILAAVASRPAGEWSGSSVAAAELSGALARELGRLPQPISITELRARLTRRCRALAGADRSRVGCGTLEPAALDLSEEELSQ